MYNWTMYLMLNIIWLIEEEELIKSFPLVFDQISASLWLTIFYCEIVHLFFNVLSIIAYLLQG